MSSAEPEVDLLFSIESGGASRRILEFAARGFVPLPPGELVRAVATIVRTGDEELVGLAEETFKGFDVPALKQAVLSDGVRTEQLDAIARRSGETEVLEPLIRHRNVGNDTLAWLAERVGPWLQDVLVTNQRRLLQAPVIVERLFENPNLSTEIRRRADEFLEEFFLKKIREEEEETTRARASDAAKTNADSTKAGEVEAEAQRKEDQAEEPDRELTEDEKKSLFARVTTMTVMQRIRLAYRGNREERLFLVRDSNRLVSTAVLKSPKTREGEAESIANMRSISEDVLRGIAFRKEWMKKYSIMLAIVKNPRSPMDITVKLISRLTARDLKILGGDRNVPEVVRSTARRAATRNEAP